MKLKLTSLEKRWVLYDVGNSAFTMLISTIMPIYFNYLAGNAGISDVDYLAYWVFLAHWAACSWDSHHPGSGSWCFLSSPNPPIL